MSKFIVAIVSIHLLTLMSASAQNKVGQNIVKQLKTNLEKSCTSDDYLNCIGISEPDCMEVTGTQLDKFEQIIHSQSQAIADGDISQTLSEIKNARNRVLEQNNIDIKKANACGKEFLVN
jgi:hypothetical protein